MGSMENWVMEISSSPPPPPHGALEWDVLREGFAGDDHARGVGADVADHPLDLLGRVHEASERVVRAEAVELRLQAYGLLHGAGPEGD